MPHVVTQACCGDASCVYACPVNCIHPTPDEPDFLLSEMLYIDPAVCVDCGACAEACPVDAIVPHTKLSEGQLPYLDINSVFHEQKRNYPAMAPVPPTIKIKGVREPLRVAIVGSGPAAMYAADELLKQAGVVVNIFEKLPVPYGLVRFGVAPDHQATKKVTNLFEQIEQEPGFNYFLNVEVGSDISHKELLDSHHAVIYASGASADKPLGIPGEFLAGSVAATEFVAWYNGHPDYIDHQFDLSCHRAVVVGNGNVALDVARILAAEPDDLMHTDIAPYALEALRASKIQEVVVLARRGFGQAAYTLPELTGLLTKPGVDVVVEKSDLVLDANTAAQRDAGSLEHSAVLKLEAVENISSSDSQKSGSKRIVLRYLLSPTAITGSDSVTGIDLSRNELVHHDDGSITARATSRSEHYDTGLVLRSIGYRGVGLPGVPFDETRMIIPNIDGRVLKSIDSEVLSGVYATGWIKRGPSGFIGTNKTCARETVSNLVEDFNDGRLASPRNSPEELHQLLIDRGVQVIDIAGWQAINSEECSRGNDRGAPREKFSKKEELLSIVEATGKPTEVKKRIRLGSSFSFS
ncbi:MAG: FAD-dependent oxidoreductase [Mycobacteriaceae bacterium]